MYFVRLFSLCITFLVVVNPTLAQVPRQVQKPVSLPESIRHVPPDSMFFLHVRTSEIRASGLGKHLLETELWSKETERSLSKDLGISIDDLESITLLWLPSPPEWDKTPNALALAQLITPDIFTESLLLTAKKPFNRAKVVRGMRAKKDATILFLSDRSILLTTKGNVLRYTKLQQRPKDKLPPSAALKLAAEKHPLVCGVYLSKAMQQMVKTSFELEAMLESLLNKSAGCKESKTKKTGVNEATFAPLLNLRSGALAIDFSKTLQVHLQMKGERENDVRLATQALKTLLVLADSGLEDLAKHQDKTKVQVINAIRKSLQAAQVKRRGNTTHVHADLKLDAQMTQALIDSYNQWEKTEAKKDTVK